MALSLVPSDPASDWMLQKTPSVKATTGWLEKRREQDWFWKEEGSG